ncbi:sulfatase-like hydrolase/transferase [Prosthecobacter sp. SYSU 5D2]|uniref:sulfatase family protein n=1 Tax=Prosthecobacter sp. SYSU 5D2 TaxID=3134134 RepID=UPI0031FF234E
MKLVYSFIALLLAQVSVAAAADTKKPNILFIYTDDHSYRTLSCYEGAESWAHTPNMDRLATRGVRFTRAYIGTWCMPSRTTMLTGLHQYGVQTMRMAPPYPGATYDPEKCRFWPAVFRQHGYQTAQIGKWHAGNDAGFGRDWDYQVVWNRPRHPDNAPNYYENQLIAINGGEPQVVKGYSTDNYTGWAVDYIKGANREAGKPWYLWLCYGGVHAPYQPAERHLNDYPGATVETPADIYPPRPGKPGYMQTIAAWERGPDGEPVLGDKAIGSEVGDDFERDRGRTLSKWSRQYHQAVRALDEGIGQVHAALEDSGQLANTLVVLTADQGYAWGHHGFRAKLAPYDANIRSPLIVSMPGTLPEGKVCHTPVGGADMAPTFFSFAGLDLPWTMHGHDLTPLLKNPDAAWPHTTLLPFTADKFGADCDRVPEPPGNRHKAGVPWYLLLVEGHFKYIRTLEANEPEELYDLASDPDELTNLAPDAKHALTVERFRAAAIAELQRTGAKMVDTLPPVKVLKN